MESKIILPKSFYETQDAPDPGFVRQMVNLDRYLLVYFNKFRARWVIDRYICETDHQHHPGCPRVNVHLVQGDDGEYHPLNDRVLDYLRKGDMWKSNPDTINRELDEKKAAWDRSRDNDIHHYCVDAMHDEHIHSESTIGASK